MVIFVSVFEGDEEMAKHSSEPTPEQIAAARETGRRVERVIAAGRMGDAHARTQAKLDNTGK